MQELSECLAVQKNDGYAMLYNWFTQPRGCNDSESYLTSPMLLSRYNEAVVCLRYESNAAWLCADGFCLGGGSRFEGDVSLLT